MARFARLALCCMALLGFLSGQGCMSSPPVPDTTSADTTDDGNTDSTVGTGGPRNGGTSSSNVVAVEIDDFAFVPKAITVRAGQTVRWTNRDFPPHTVTSGNPEDTDKGVLFDSGTLGVGKAFEYTFETPGTYEYFCTYHYGHVTMRDATVTVIR